jgi:8-oxo-dGTP pyrophosphatase MutT (NUDIX family)
MDSDIMHAGVAVTDGITVMLAKRATHWRGKPLSYGGYWSVFAGTVEPDETPFKGAERELDEETGIKITHPLKFIRKINGRRKIPFYFYVYEVDKIPFPVLDEEHTEWGLFRITDLGVSPSPIDGDIVRCLKFYQESNS